MRLRDLFRRPAPAPDPGPPPAPAVRPAWPDLPPVQRVVSAPSLVTAPQRFRQGLASWANPSFLSTPGHLIMPDAPSGSVEGLSRTIHWAPPLSRWPGSGRDDGAADDAPAAAPPADPAPLQRAVEQAPVQRAVEGTPVQRAVEGTPVQRAVDDPLPLRRLPAVAPLPVFGGSGLASAAAAPVPEPAWRPAVPAREPLPAREPPAEAPGAGGPQFEAPRVDEPHVEEPPVETPQAAVAAETVVPGPSPSPLPVQTLAEHPSPSVDPLAAPRRRIGLGAPLPPPSATVGAVSDGVSPLAARLLESPSAPVPARPTGPARPSPAPEPVKDSQPVPEPAEQPPMRLLQRHPGHEKASLVGEVPLGISPAEDVPVQRTLAPEPAAHGVPAVGSALPAPARAGTTSPVAAPPVAGSPESVVHRHAHHDEAPLAGAWTPLAHPPDDVEPVQRTLAAEPATHRMPADGNALLPPAGQSTAAPSTGSPAGPTVLPEVAVPIAPPAAAAVAALTGERPPVARIAEGPAVVKDHFAEATSERSPAPVAQRAVDAGQPAPSGRYLPAGVREPAAPTGPAENAAIAVEAGLVGEWPIAQRVTDPVPQPPVPQPPASPAPASPAPASPAPASPAPASPAPASQLPAPTPRGAAVPAQLGLVAERPIVLRVFDPFPVPPAGSVEATTPLRAGESLGRPVGTAPVPTAGAEAFAAPAVQRLPVPQAQARPPLAIPVMPAPRALPSSEPAQVAEPGEETVTLSRLTEGGSAPASPEAGSAAPATPPAPAGETHAGAPAAAGAAPARASVDAEVERLFDPLTRLFKAELRLDRERVGHALDLRY